MTRSTPTKSRGAKRSAAKPRPSAKAGATKRRAKPPAKARPSARAGASKPPSTKRAPAKRAPARPAKRPAAKRGASIHPGKAAGRASSKPAKRAASVHPGKAGGATASTARSDARWLRFVEQHGVVLASARGPVPSLAEAIAGEPIVGSWWSHAKAHAIFEALSAIDDDVDVRCFKLVDGKVTLVHRRLWPALVRLVREGAVPAERAASLQQEHMPTGEHRNLVTPFPDWVDDATARAADALSHDAARSLLSWL